MESESGENVGFFWVLRKPLLLLFCGVSIVQRLSNLLYDVIWSLHSSATPRYYQNILLSYPPEKKKNENYTAIFCHRLGKRKCPTKNQRNNLVEA